jgi:hypothetical protein
LTPATDYQLPHPAFMIGFNIAPAKEISTNTPAQIKKNMSTTNEPELFLDD